MRIIWILFVFLTLYFSYLSFLNAAAPISTWDDSDVSQAGLRILALPCFVIGCMLFNLDKKEKLLYRWIYFLPVILTVIMIIIKKLG